MSDHRVAVRYAKSLLVLAIEQEKLELVKSDMEMFLGLCDGSKPFLNFLKNPIIHVYKKVDVFKKLFDGKVDELTFAFIDIVTRKGREELLPLIGQEFLEEYRNFKKIKIVEVTTTFEIDKTLKDEFIRLSQQLIGEGKTIQLKEKVEEDLIGGYVLRIGDRQIDDSVSSKLRDLKKKLTVT